MVNQKTRTVTIRWVIGRRMFAKGHADQLKGRPFCPEYETANTQDQHLYETGRILGIVYKGRLKEGQRVLGAACSAYANMQAEGYLPNHADHKKAA